MSRIRVGTGEPGRGHIPHRPPLSLHFMPHLKGVLCIPVPGFPFYVTPLHWGPGFALTMGGKKLG